MLEVRDLTAGYGSVVALRDVDLSVSTGEVVAVLGANGAGKSTLARTISGTTRLLSGTISFEGADIRRTAPHARSRLGIVHVPEGRRLFGSLTVEQNVMLGRQAARRRRDDRDPVELLLDALPRVRDLWRTRAGVLSGGEQQMVALVRAAAGRPRLLILDEPSLGLSPRLVGDVFAVIGMLTKELNCAVLLIEQLASQALAAADRGIVIANGRVTATGPAAELLDSDAIRQAYLGGNAS
ncbi:ABC transporter ATP-binding protein [Actinomadura sp. 1N219]|uniref:ABC transporter ATP-binding protein n=1 Tax=Actinomadura sp. 1N219 TaxID=3375152 RepID=UPI0037AA713C